MTPTQGRTRITKKGYKVRDITTNKGKKTTEYLGKATARDRLLAAWHKFITNKRGRK